ncbi:C-C chemokine receptor-like 2 isoform X2 [Dasypus novemcinctus]|nr:C-C chemokine receptor-like 2 isoform X2 [Dasypus novemcinctus]XP_058144205.1 C-C chemokine receptor-like 2 isoform X2 [Dasypus novemcinctus]
MDNYRTTPGDYDVRIEGDLQKDPEQCGKYNASLLSGLLLPPLYPLVFLAGVLGNVLVVLILVKYRGLKHLENIYFLNLAVSNLLFLALLPFWAHSASQGGVLGHRACKALAGVYSISLYSEALFGVLLTTRAFRHERGALPAVRTARRGLAVSAGVWTAVAVVAVVELAFYQPPPGGQENGCTFDRPHFLPTDGALWEYVLTLTMNLFGLLLPLVVLVFGLVFKGKTLRSRESRDDLAKLVLAIMVIFLLMWAPFNFALFLSTFKERFSLHDCNSTYRLDRGTQITKIIATTHCCINPLLYVCLDQTFRTQLGRLFHLSKGTRVRTCEDAGRDQATQV